MTGDYYKSGEDTIEIVKILVSPCSYQRVICMDHSGKKRNYSLHDLSQRLPKTELKTGCLKEKWEPDRHETLTQCWFKVGPASTGPTLNQYWVNVSCLLGIYRPLGYERVYLPLCKVADTPFHIQGGRYSDAGVLAGVREERMTRRDTETESRRQDKYAQTAEQWSIWKKPTRKELMLQKCWAGITDADPTLNQHFLFTGVLYWFPEWKTSIKYCW